MAAALQIKDGCCLEMCTQLPGTGEVKDSPVFSLMGDEWYIRFCSTQSSGYHADIIPKNVRKLFKSFVLDFSIGFKDEEHLSLGKGSTKIMPGSVRIWHMEQATLQSKLPLGRTPDYFAGNFIKFVLRFYLPKEPRLQLRSMSQDKYVQATSYADSSIGSLSKDFSILLDSGLYHDVEIKCEKKSIKAHKIILCARSEVFRAMLQSDMVEGRTGIVQIQDIDISGIQDFVKYLYTDTLAEMTFNKAMTLYKAGDKYAVQSLMNQCSKYLQENLSQENACQCLALADTHCDKRLKDNVVAYILETKLFLQDEFWSPFCERYPKIALDVHRLSQKNTSA